MTGPVATPATGASVRLSAGERDRSGSVLTPRQTEVMTRLAHGQSWDEVMAALGVGRHTVETHVRQSYERLGVVGEVTGWACGARLAAFRALGWLRPPAFR